MKTDLNAQCRNAIEFIQKLHFEISYLIKEIEGLLQKEPENFIIERPAGYQVTSRTSTGLDPGNVENWQPKTFTVFFCPSERTKIIAGQTRTQFDRSLRLLIVHIEIMNQNKKGPRILCGCLTDIVNNKPKKITKIEYILAKFAYFNKKIFGALPNVSYSDTDCSFEGEFFEQLLFSINNSDDVMNKLVKNMLKLYRK